MSFTKSTNTNPVHEMGGQNSMTEMKEVYGVTHRPYQDVNPTDAIVMRDSGKSSKEALNQLHSKYTHVLGNNFVALVHSWGDTTPGVDGGPNQLELWCVPILLYDAEKDEEIDYEDYYSGGQSDSLKALRRITDVCTRNAINGFDAVAFGGTKEFGKLKCWDLIDEINAEIEFLMNRYILALGGQQTTEDFITHILVDTGDAVTGLVDPADWLKVYYTLGFEWRWDYDETLNDGQGGYVITPWFTKPMLWFDNDLFPDAKKTDGLKVQLDITGNHTNKLPVEVAFLNDDGTGWEITINEVAVDVFVPTTQVVPRTA